MKKKRELPDVLVYEYNYFDGHRIRVYENDDGWHSATYLEPELRNELIFEYMKKFNLMFALPLDISDVLMIGGGAFSYPKYLLSHYPDIVMDVVEIDENAAETAKRFFFLDELIEQYDLENTRRLNIITDDGRHYVENNRKKYDVIINDAFTGLMPEFTLYTVEAAGIIKTNLKEDGVLVANLPGFIKFEGSQYLQNTLRTFQEVFRHVLIVRAATDLYESHTCNYVMFASDLYDEIPGMLEYTLKNPVIMHDSAKNVIINNYEF